MRKRMKVLEKFKMEYNEYFECYFSEYFPNMCIYSFEDSFNLVNPCGEITVDLRFFEVESVRQAQSMIEDIVYAKHPQRLHFSSPMFNN